MNASLLQRDINQVVIDMIKCPQTSTQSVYQHGQSVNFHLIELLSHLKNETSLENWKLPDLFKKHGKQILENLHCEEILNQYAVFHDIGKPYCIEYDSDGKKHFPNHAQVSKEIWLSTGGNEIVGNLIGWDMDIHTLSSEEIAKRCSEEWTREDAFSLLITSLVEIHSNAKLFGGLESVSFKSKFKTVERRGNQICKFFL